MQSSRDARDALRCRTLSEGQQKTYVLGPLTEDQKNDENVIELKLNNYQRGYKTPGSILMHADISAPDLFLWLKYTLMNMAGLEEP